MILFTKKYIEFIDNGKSLTTSINPLKKILIKMFEKSVFTDEQYEKNEELESKRELVYNKFQEAFNRSLSPIEISRIDNWIVQEVDLDIILNALKDALRANKLSISYIDRIIINKIREEDLNGNKI